MFRRSIVFAMTLVPVLLATAGSGAEPMAPAAAWISQDAILVVEVPQPKAILDQVFRERLVEMVTSHPTYKEQLAKPQTQQALNLVNYFKGKYDADLPELLAKLLGGGITWAVGPDETNLLIVDAEDADFLKDVHEFLLLIARGEAQKEGQADRVASAEYRGVTGWRFGPNEAHAIIGNRLLVTNKPEVLKMALDLRAEEGASALADLSGYRTAKEAVGDDCVATVFANMGVLKQLPGLQRALSENENPLATLLFAPMQRALREATWVTMGMRLDGNNVELDVVTDGTATDSSAADGFALPETANGGALPNLEVPRQIAGLSFYRDLYRFYAAKDDLFPERTSGLIFFENMMGIFFTGRDLTEEVLAETEPDVRVVVAEQEYDPEIGTPQVQIPGFAAVFRMRDREKFAPIVEEAWQKALGLINFTRGQQALAGLIIDRPTHADTRYTMAYFSAAEEEDRSAVDVRFNFQPTLAMPGDYLILSSCDRLTRDLIDALQKESQESRGPIAGTHSVGQLSGVHLSSILKANREALIRQNMVEEGNTQEQAEQQIGILLEILKHIRQVAIVAGTEGDQEKLTVKLDLDLP